VGCQGRRPSSKPDELPMTLLGWALIFAFIVIVSHKIDVFALVGALYNKD
jgi:hypothetical protein